MEPVDPNEDAPVAGPSPEAPASEPVEVTPPMMLAAAAIPGLLALVFLMLAYYKHVELLWIPIPFLVGISGYCLYQYRRAIS